MKEQEKLIEEHQASLLAAFGQLLLGEEMVRQLKIREDGLLAEISAERRKAETAIGVAWAEIKALMSETGEVEVVLPGSVTDYKIGYSATRESVKVEPDAVPEQFCKIERKPRLKEIGEFLSGLRDQGLALPNWARFEMSEPKLKWAAIKKQSTKE